MADVVPRESALGYDENEKNDKFPNDSSEKVSFGSDEKNVIDDAAIVREVEALEERLENDDAADSEYFIQDAADVALKVLSTKDDPDLPSLTFRTFFLGLGFSAFGAYVFSIRFHRLTVHTIVQCPRPDLLLQASDPERVPALLVGLDILDRKWYAHCSPIQGHLPLDQPWPLQQ